MVIKLEIIIGSKNKIIFSIYKVGIRLTADIGVKPIIFIQKNLFYFNLDIYKNHFSRIDYKL